MRRKPQASRPGFGLVLPEERQAESKRKGQECGPLWLAWKVECPSSVAHDLVERLQGGAVPVVAVRGDALPIGAVAKQTELLGEVLASGALPDLRENPLVHLCPSPDLGHSPPRRRHLGEAAKLSVPNPGAVLKRTGLRYFHSQICDRAFP